MNRVVRRGPCPTPARAAKVFGCWGRRAEDQRTPQRVSFGRANSEATSEDTTRADLETRVNQDPFVANDVVTAELLEVSCSQADPRLGFLRG
jgi:hypothetical protein